MKHRPWCSHATEAARVATERRTPVLRRRSSGTSRDNAWLFYINTHLRTPSSFHIWRNIFTNPRICGQYLGYPWRLRCPGSTNKKSIKQGMTKKSLFHLNKNFRWPFRSEQRTRLKATNKQSIMMSFVQHYIRAQNSEGIQWKTEPNRTDSMDVVLKTTKSLPNSN